MAFRPQTDGQTERINSIIEQYLGVFVNYQQNHWAKLLPLVEFAANNYVLEAVNCSAFFGNNRFNPWMSVSQHPIRDPKDIQELNAQQSAQLMEQLFSEFQVEIKRVQAIHPERAN